MQRKSFSEALDDLINDYEDEDLEVLISDLELALMDLKERRE